MKEQRRIVLTLEEQQTIDASLVELNAKYNVEKENWKKMSWTLEILDWDRKRALQNPH